MIFPLELTASGEKFVSCIVSSEEYYYLNFAIHCVCWCYFYTVKQQPCRRINNLNKIFFLKKCNWNTKKDLCSTWQRCCDWSKWLIPTSTTPKQTSWKPHTTKASINKTKQKQKHSHNLPLRWCKIMFLWWPSKNCDSLTGKFWLTCCTHQTVQWAPWLQPSERS